MGTKRGQGKRRFCTICGDTFTRQGNRKTCSTNCRDVFAQLRNMSGRNNGGATDLAYWTEDKRRKHSEQSKQRYLDRPDIKDRIGNALKGRTRSDETRRLLSVAMQKRLAEGRHNGWSSRKVTSYPERFWMNVLDQYNIEYEREVRVGKYFLDFVVRNIDLEIDGKQHQYDDRIQSDKVRDEFLSNEGFTVYRIPWVNPNSEERSLIVKEQIENLLEVLFEV